MRALNMSDEYDAITHHCRKRALRTGWDTDSGTPPANEDAPPNGQEAVLAALDWSLRLAARWHAAAVGRAGVGTSER